MDSTKPESTSANSTAVSSAPGNEPVKSNDTTDRIHINAPEKGAIQIVDVQNAEEIAFNFNLKDVRVSAIDVDLVLLFPDNSKLILPGLAMGLLGAKPPKLRALNEIIHSQDIVSAISQVALADTTPSVHLASADFLPKKQGGNASDDKASADGSENAEASRPSAADLVVTPVRPITPSEKASGSSASGARVEVVEAGSIASSKVNSASAAGEPPAPKNPPPSATAQSSSAAQGNAPFSMKAADLTIKALAIAESSETPQSSGKIIVGGSGGAEGADDASFAAQSARESLAGGSGNDIIYADDPRFSNNGSAARLLDVTVTMPTSSIAAKQATISGLPTGYSILNASNINGNWVMPVGTIKPNNFQIQLVYKVPDDATKPDANGFYNRFTMSISFDGTNAGGGNDTLDGGAGNDTVDYSYVLSSGTTNGLNGITVTLNGGTSVNVTGLATGDQDSIRNFEHVIGTSFNDSIAGDSNANSLAGGSGHDTIAGFGSADTLDGGAGNDCIIGTGGSDIMRGGANNDYMLIDQTFLGGGGSIDGGTGSDTLSFAASSGNLTLTNANFDNIVTNVEVLDFTSVGTNVTMSLNATDIASLTGQGLGVNNKLDIFQNSGDQISIATQAGYSYDTSTSNGVTTYTFYNSTDPHDPANQLAQINVHGS